MPVWPKSFHVFNAGLRTAATEWKLRRRHAASAAQERAFARLLPMLAASSHWRAAGLRANMDYPAFRAHVPPQTHERLHPAVERMRQGEAGVLWPGRCALFAQSSGTTTGVARTLPVTEELLRHFREATREALLYYTVRARHARVLRGRHLLLGGATTITRLPEGVHMTNATGLVAASLPAWAERHLFEPGHGVAGMADWEARLDCIAARTHHRDITLMAALPGPALMLADKLRSLHRETLPPPSHLRTLWPKLECFLHTGEAAGPHFTQLQAALGPDVAFHEVYAATEGFIATQDTHRATDGLRVMADMGLFFEFLPMTDFDEARLDRVGPKAMPLAEVKTGVDYAILLTSPGGLARTLLGDVVRFTSTAPHRLVYVGRTGLRLDTFGEAVSEKDITDSLVSICTRHGWSIVNFHVAPLPVASSSQSRGRHEWWVELKPGSVQTPTGPQLAAKLDVELQRINPTYATRRRSGGPLEPPVVRLVMPGVFEHWLRYEGKWGGQHRLPRCRPDRRIADPLAQITNFAAD